MFASFNENNEVQITVGKQTFTVNAHFDGETCWERCHPTFISKKRKVIITERSIETDKNIFAKMLFDTNQMTQLEYNMYNYWYEKLFPEVKIKNIIYLN